MIRNRAKDASIVASVAETQREKLKMLLSNGSFWRPKALLAEGIGPHTIAQALRVGEVARTASREYYLPGLEPHQDLTELTGASSRMRRAVICLLSSAYLEDLTDVKPPRLWVALPQGTHASTVDSASRHVIRWSFPGAFEIGIAEMEVAGVKVRHTSGARTVVDLVRFARLIGGLAPATAAANRYMEAGGKSQELLELARLLRAPSATLQALETILVTLKEVRR